MPALTVTVITYNEAASIRDTLQSVSWADEIIVIDSNSTDRTVEIAREYTSRVEVRDWAGYGPQKNYAASLASHDWILSIDADERITPPLADEIRAVMRTGPSAQAYSLPRVSFYLGRWIRSTDWYPDFHVRLYDRRAARWTEQKVHESVRATGRVEKLRGEMLHYPYRDMSEHLAKIDQYTTLVAEQWAAEGRRATALQAFIYPRLAFFRNYVLKRGFIDGQTGLLVSLLNSYYVFLKYAKLIERQRHCSSLIPDPESLIPDPRFPIPDRDSQPRSADPGRAPHADQGPPGPP